MANMETPEEKRKLIRNFCDSVRNEVCRMAAKMPVEFDGHELRYIVAEKFAHEVTEVFSKLYHGPRRNLRRRKAADAWLANNWNAGR